jgi:hypothetical protein
VLAYPKKYPKFNHLGKNIEVVIDKALKEENPEKKQGFANAIAYYMKLTYSNWHKELVHDDTIQNELSSITNGELEFNNRPFVKHTAPRIERDEYPAARNNNYRKNFGSRDRREPQQSNNRNSNNNRNNDTRGGGGGGGNRDNRQGSGQNNNNRNFKKRF